MSVFLLNDSIEFPHPSLADDDGLLAVGGDLSASRLLLAYTWGIFPWYNQGEEIYWWAPAQRFVLFPEKLKMNKSFKAVVRNKTCDITMNTRFEEVIDQCSKIPRRGQTSTWIGSEMRAAYINLHRLGVAVSVEVCRNNALLAGLYGVQIGRVFCGESMFHTQNNTGKIALYALIEYCLINGIVMIDVQMHTDFFERMGAEYIPLSEYLHILHGDL